MKKVRITESQLKGLVKRIIKEERDSTIMLSLGRKVYQDLKNKGFKVFLNQTRKADNMQAQDRKYDIGNKGYGYDRADFFITSSYYYVEITQDRKQYQSNSSITEMNNVLEELKQKYENEDVSAHIGRGLTSSQHPQLVFSLKKKGNY
jgi:hypothetical protein